MDALARTYENAAHWLEVEADFLTLHNEHHAAASMRKQATRLRAKANDCYRHAQRFNTLPTPTKLAIRNPYVTIGNEKLNLQSLLAMLRL